MDDAWRTDDGLWISDTFTVLYNIISSAVSVGIICASVLVGVPASAVSDGVHSPDWGTWYSAVRCASGRGDATCAGRGASDDDDARAHQGAAVRRGPDRDRHRRLHPAVQPLGHGALPAQHRRHGHQLTQTPLPPQAPGGAPWPGAAPRPGAAQGTGAPAGRSHCEGRAQEAAARLLPEAAVVAGRARNA